MTAHATKPSPPRAAQRPASRAAHGFEWTDEYEWLRADNWRDALRDPATLPQDIRALIEAENVYAEAILAPTKDLQATIVREMRARIKEDDSSPPQVDGPFAYYSRFREGGQHRVFCRKPREGGDETVLLDGDARAKGKAFFEIEAIAHSPDHSKFAWSADSLGSEILAISVCDVAAGRDAPDSVTNATGAIVWTRDSRAFLYVEQDEAHRPFRIMLHRLGTGQDEDVELFAERDPAWFLGISGTRLGRAALVSVHGHDGSETHLIDLEDPLATPLLIAPRRSGHFYDVMDHGDGLYIRTNRDARDFRVVRGPRAAGGEAEWRDVVPHRAGRFVADCTLGKDFLVALVREDSKPRLAVYDLASGASHDIAFAEETYDLEFATTYEFDTPLFRFRHSAMNRPETVLDYDCATRARNVVKRQDVPGFDPELYVTRLIFAPAEDGERVPVSLLMRRDFKPDGTAPLLLYGYGSYGWSVEASFGANRLSLVDRGFVYAIAHVRGGTDKGWGWYEDGKLLRKPNTFSDFVAAARHLIAEGYTREGRIVSQGGSAGGLLVGAAANMAPALFAGVVADVPFVDALTTMMDETLPLTPAEWLEWGDPIRDRAAFETIRSYSPYDNVKPQPYPPILALAGLSDPRVTYWEPTKWVQRLRATMTGGGPVILHTDMGAGHGGQPGRFDRLGEVAMIQAFALACVSGALGER
jgi:oligopeptidase B